MYKKSVLHNKKILSTYILIIAFFVMQIFLENIFVTHAADFSFIQNNWSTQTTSKAIHPNNQTGWNGYSSASSVILSSSSFSLSTTSVSFTQTDSSSTTATGFGFNNPDFGGATTEIVENGINAAIGLKHNAPGDQDLYIGRYLGKKSKTGISFCKNTGTLSTSSFPQCNDFLKKLMS